MINFEVVVPPLATSASTGWRGSFKRYDKRGELVAEVYKSTVGDTVTYKGRAIVLEGRIDLSYRWDRLPKWVGTMLLQAEEYFPTKQYQRGRANG